MGKLIGYAAIVLLLGFMGFIHHQDPTAIGRYTEFLKQQKEQQVIGY